MFFLQIIYSSIELCFLYPTAQMLTKKITDAGLKMKSMRCGGKRGHDWN